MLQLIDRKLKELGIPIDGVADNGDGTYRIDFRKEATKKQKETAQLVLDNKETLQPKDKVREFVGDDINLENLTNEQIRKLVVKLVRHICKPE